MSAVIRKSAKKEAAVAEVKTEKKSATNAAGKLMTLIPRMSEKAYSVSQVLNTYVFVVPKSANKHSVAQAVSAQFEVTVVGVNTSNINGKEIRTYRKRSRGAVGRQNDYKKAYVTLKEGDSLPLFAAVEEQEAKSEKLQVAADKAAEKRAKKEKK
ncbi:MAG TPA: 50S ribosomal protein L23 [Candidatus Saccharimonadales bacterium]|nr:50S ribosomal protein L23 [Candidatus Saccharimonadales bacterium]